MHQQGDVAQSCSAAFAPTGDKHHFSGAEDFIMEQRAGNPRMSRLAEDKIVGVRIVIIYGRTSRIALPFKRAGDWEFVTERRLLT